MGKHNELNVTVNARLTVQRDDADRALQIVNWFLRDNPEIEMIGNTIRDPERYPGKFIQLEFKEPERKAAKDDR